MDNPNRPTSPIIGIPSDRTWFDPRLILAATDMVTTDVVIPAGVVTQVAVPDPRRVAIGFVLRNLLAAEPLVGPWPDVFTYPTATLVGGQLVWYHLHEHLTLVCSGWWVNVSNGGRVRVITVTRK